MRIALALALAVLPAPLAAKEIVAADYVEPTDAYGHGALPGGEYAGLELRYADGSRNILRFEAAVFEDTAPRLHDFDGDGKPEVVAVLSGFETGAMVMIFGHDGEAARPLGQTAAIGQRHRWLAIAGIADFDGDGVDEIAYVDRPHLARTLRLVRVVLQDGQASFTQAASAPGLSNHRYGAEMIEGGVRDCPGAAPVIVTADAGWREIVATRLEAGRLVSTSAAPYDGPDSFAPVMACR
ncbi:VCBS repeat-containing protein [Maritimibacter sp. HL-12]|uniref:FG-GAP repeat domain-containing protein n=1 Tax=Maritimibacter sp. HL-12 TaxID=1162418 RepID=UPI000A0F39C3|nr:VCBS repeat-containing protein [Maritimibacter sp. HL-12]SMH52797.1 Repeat domain-containing protein [Maritimibacter sp. HL-12]